MTRRSLLLPLALALLVAAGGCRHDDRTKGGDAPEPAAETRLPAGVLGVVSTVPTSGRIGEHTSSPGVAFSDDTVLLLTPTGHLEALDRATLEPRWEAEVPFDSAGYGACTRPTLTPGARTVTLFVGLQCQAAMTYHLRTGTLVDASPADISGSGHGLIGDDVWFADASSVNVVADGSHRAVLGRKDLSMSESDLITALAVMPDDDLLVLHILNGDDTKRVVGIRVNGTAADVVWERPATPEALRFPASPKPGDLRYDTEVPGGLMIGTTRTGDVLVGRPDPDDGSLADHLTFRKPFSRGQLAVWGVLPDYAVLGDTLISAIGEGDLAGYDQIAAYDLGSGEELWTTTIDAGFRAKAVSAEIVGVTGNRAHAYVAFGDNVNQVLSEVDLESGEESRRWELPPRVEALSEPELFVDGDLVVALADPATGEPGNDAAMVLRATTPSG
jgi:hypothetical protein